METDLEMRVRRLEERFAFWAGAMGVLTASLFALLGITDWENVPHTVDAQVTDLVEAVAVERIRIANEEAGRFLTSIDESGTWKQQVNLWAETDLTRSLCDLNPLATYSLRDLTCYLQSNPWNIYVAPPFPTSLRVD